MRIAMVSGHASPLADPGGSRWGGQTGHVDALSRALGAAGHEVEVWTRRDSPGLSASVLLHPGVTLRHIDAGPPVPLDPDRLVPHLPRVATALEDAWVADPPDVVHAHFWLSGLAAVAAAARLGIPVVQTFHELGHVEQRHRGEPAGGPRGRVSAERVIAGRAAQVIATCSDEVVELGRLAVPRTRIAVVPSGVDADEFTPDGPASARDPDVPRLLSVGGLERHRGADELIRALGRVPRAELLVAGGPDPDAAEGDADLRRLRGTAAAAGVSRRVRFLGAVARHRLPGLMRSADAVVCVPWYEPSGTVALEAMASGRAVVASAVGGIGDAVVDGVTGVQVPPRRPDRLAAALRTLLAQPAMLQAFGIAGRDRALACFGWDRTAAATARAYEQVADGPRDGSVTANGPPAEDAG